MAPTGKALQRPNEAPCSRRAGRLAHGRPHESALRQHSRPIAEPHTTATPRRASRPAQVLLGLALGLTACDEPTRLAWDDGVLRAEGPGTPREEHGEWEHFYHDGQLRARGRYEDGLKVGTWETFYPSGGQGGGIQARGARLPLREEGISPRHGVWSFFHPSGQLQRRGRFERGEPVGLFEEWHGSGTLKLRERFEGGLRQGPFEEWFDNGQLRARGDYENGLREGPWEGHARDGAVDEALDGLWSEGVRTGPRPTTREGDQ